MTIESFGPIETMIREGGYGLILVEKDRYTIICRGDHEFHISHEPDSLSFFHMLMRDMDYAYIYNSLHGFERFVVSTEEEAVVFEISVHSRNTSDEVDSHDVYNGKEEPISPTILRM